MYCCVGENKHYYYYYSCHAYPFINGDCYNNYVEIVSSTKCLTTTIIIADDFRNSVRTHVTQKAPRVLLIK